MHQLLQELPQATGGFGLLVTVANVIVLLATVWNAREARKDKNAAAASSLLARREAETYQRLERQVATLEHLLTEERDRHRAREQDLVDEVARCAEQNAVMTERIHRLEGRVVELETDLRGRTQ